MAGELRLNEVSTPSTPASGKDAIYMTSATPSQLGRVDSAGTVWNYSPVAFISLTSSYTPTMTATTPNQVFNSTTSGQITLPGSQTWQFEAVYLITNTGTTSHTWGVLFGGTATLTSIAYVAQAETATSNALTAVSQIYATAATNTVVTAASTSATENVIIKLNGIVRINGAGTFIPEVQTSATPGGTQTILTNSYFLMRQLGSNTNGYIGNWS